MQRYFKNLPKFLLNRSSLFQLSSFKKSQKIIDFDLEELDYSLRFPFIEWIELYKKVQVDNAPLDDLSKFFEYTNKLNIEQTQILSKDFFSDFVENDRLDILGIKEFTLFVSAIENIDIEPKHTLKIKNRLLKFNYNEIDHRNGIMLFIFTWKLEDRTEPVVFSEIEEYMKNYILATINEYKPDIFVDFLEFYYFTLFEDKRYTKLILPIINKIKNYLDDEFSLETVFFSQISASYPRLLLKIGDPDFTKNEISQLQKYLKNKKLEKVDVYVYILNNINIYAKEHVDFEFFEEKIKEIYKNITNFESQNLFHLFFFLLSTDLSKNSGIKKNLLRDTVLLIKSLGSPKFDNEKTYFIDFREKDLIKIDELTNELKSRKNETDDKYSITFLNILKDAAELNPISFTDYSNDELLVFYSNMVRLLNN